MTTPTIPVDTAVNNLLNMVTNQLNNILSMTDNHAALISEALNNEADQYDALCEITEQANDRLINEQLKNQQLQIKLSELEEIHKKEITRLNKEAFESELLLSDYKEMKKTLKELKALNPQALKKKNIELAKNKKELSEALMKYKKEAKQNSTALSTSKMKIAELAKLITEMNTEMEVYRTKLLRHDGNVIQKEYKGKDDLYCYIYEFEWGLTNKPENPEVQIINDLDWHLEVRTTHGLNVTVSVTEWLQPFYPPCDYLADRWPTDIHDGLVDVIRARCMGKHNHLIERADWASTEDLENVPGISPKHLTLLNNGNFFSVFSVCHITSNRLSKMVKGIGDKTALQIRDACMSYVRNWEKQRQQEVA